MIRERGEKRTILLPCAPGMEVSVLQWLPVLKPLKDLDAVNPFFTCECWQKEPTNHVQDTYTKASSVAQI